MGRLYAPPQEAAVGAGLIFRQQVGVGVGAGLCPDLDPVGGGLQRHAGLDQGNVAVAGAGIGDGKDVGAFLQLAGGIDALGNAGGPAMAVGLRGTGEVKGHQLGGLAGLAGHLEGGIGVGLQAAGIGDGVGQLVIAGGVGGGLAVLEGQLRQGGDGNLAGQVAVLRVGGGDAGHGVKLGTGLHGLILHTGDLRLGIVAGIAGSDAHRHTEAEQCRQTFVHGFHCGTLLSQITGCRRRHRRSRRRCSGRKRPGKPAGWRADWCGRSGPPGRWPTGRR